MEDSIPEELRSFGVTYKDFDEKRCHHKNYGDWVWWKGSLFQPFLRFGNKSNKLSNIVDALLEFGSLQG